MKTSDIEKAVHRVPFYRAYKRFKNGAIPGKVTMNIDSNVIVDVPEGATIINAQYANDVYKGVEFNSQGFPIFKTEFRVKIDEMFYLSTDDVQFMVGNDLLYEAIQSNSKLIDVLKLKPDDIIDLSKGIKPKGYTWHHNQNSGILELVNSRQHRVNHLGGRNIWGGGKAYR